MYIYIISFVVLSSPGVIVIVGNGQDGPSSNSGEESHGKPMCLAILPPAVGNNKAAQVL